MGISRICGHSKGGHSVRHWKISLGLRETGLYGQVCWSVANRGAELPSSREVITLEGEDSKGSRSSREFRLTRKSIGNVGRRMGVRTCDEAMTRSQSGRRSSLLWNALGGVPERASGTDLRLHGRWYKITLPVVSILSGTISTPVMMGLI